MRSIVSAMKSWIAQLLGWVLMDDIQKKTEEFLRESKIYLDSRDKNPQQTLFHYTSYQGLTGILQSQRLWQTDHKYLNDPSEIQHGKNLILNFVKAYDQKNLKLSNFLQYLINDIIDKGYKTFLTAFCELGDYLPAWRYYGDNGAGFSIGFRKEYFLHSDTETRDADSTFLYQVKYQNDQFEEIRDIFAIADRIYPNWYMNDVSKVRPFSSALITNLLSILPGVKNEDYKDEKEWRLCLVRIFHEKTNTWYPTARPMERLIIDTLNNPRIPPFAKDIRTTIPRLESLKFDFSDIDTIYIGPRLDFLTAKLAIEKILIDAGISKSDLQGISIKRSERPYQ